MGVYKTSIIQNYLLRKSIIRENDIYKSVSKGSYLHETMWNMRICHIYVRIMRRLSVGKYAKNVRMTDIY